MDQTPHIELRHLRYFEAVAEELNYRRAARRLHVSASALSVQVKQLENMIEARLLDRDTTSVRLTPMGELFLAEARAVLAQMRKMVSVIRAGAHEKQERLRVGIHGQLGENLLQELVLAYQETFSKVDVTLHDLLGNDAQVRALDEGRVHMGIILDFEEPRLKGLDHLLLMELPMRAVMSAKHPLAALKQVSLEEMAAFPLLAIQQYEPLTQSLLALFHAESLRPKSPVRANSFHSCISMLAFQKGVAVLPEISVIRQNPQLALRPIKDPVLSALRLRIYAVWKKNNAPRQVHDLIDLLRNADKRTDAA